MIVILIFLTILGNVNNQKIKPLKVQEWAENFGAELYGFFNQISYMDKITENFKNTGAYLVKLNGTDIVEKMAFQIENMLQLKVESVKRLVDTAEEAFKEHPFNKNINISYYNAKDIVSIDEVQESDNSKKSMIFKPHEQFDNIPVNLTYSTIHVPTNVYNRDIQVLNDILWSEKLNRVFINNYELDRTLMWQYFGSETGFFRLYPGIKWELDKSNIDLYDCRVKDWYIQAATSPKDLIILIDGSGSMTGLRIEIAKLTVETIMNTLSDDDFFNVVLFTGETIFVENCFNETLVQGNEDNKNLIKDKLDSIYTKEIARFDVALQKSFELLTQIRKSDKGSHCNQAIMIVTDGAPNNFDELFKKYNPEKRVRIFTYLIGREAADTNGYLKHMSCNNKGFYAHIATLADVQENVQEYIKVISRPMVIEQEHVTIWTGIYHTKADPKTKNWLNLLESESENDMDTIRLMTSVAQPVFDRKNATLGEGNLLGVMGTDVPIEEIIKLTPQYKLGANGYPFAITNNGYILFHPDLRPMYGKQTKPNYNSIDLAEVEFSDQENPTGKNYVMKLRKDMIDQKSGNCTMVVKMAYDSMRRVYVRRNYYYYITLQRTPFSLGISIPENGLYTVKSQLNIADFDLRDLSGTGWKVIPDWVYCRLPNEENKLNDPERMIKYIKLAISAQKTAKEKFQDEFRLFTENCDAELISSFAFDAKTTSTVVSDWESQKDYAILNGVVSIFLGTRSGLTRFLHINAKNSNSTYPPDNYIDKHIKTLEELYYKRADDSGSGILVISVDHNNYPDNTFAKVYLPEDIKDLDEVTSINVTGVISSDSATPLNPMEDMIIGQEDNKFSNASSYENMFITTSSAIVITNPNNEAKATTAVIGARIKLESLANLFYKTSTVDCFQNGTICYLLDEHAYVILTSKMDPRHVGKFFGQIDGRIMLTLADHVYKRIELFDFQAMCESKVSLFSAAFLNSKVIAFIMQRLLFAIKLLFAFIQESPFKPFAVISTYFVKTEAKLFSNVTSSFFSRLYKSSIKSDDVENPYDIKTFKAPHHCQKRFHLFKLNRDLLANEGPVSLIANCGGTAAFSDASGLYEKLRFCGKPFTVSLVSHTNLVLVVARKAHSGLFDSDDNNKDMEQTAASDEYSKIKYICSLCDDLNFNYQPRSVSLTHREVSDENDSPESSYVPPTLFEDNAQVTPQPVTPKNKCFRLKKDVYRYRPTTCYSFNKFENSTICGSAYIIKNHVTFMLFSFVCCLLML